MDFPSGPLDIYRNKASFNWKEMLNFLEGEDIQTFKVSQIQVQQINHKTALVIFAAMQLPW